MQTSNDQARTVVTQVEADTEHQKLAAEPIRQAKSALKRGADARAAGDERHAVLLDELALEWAGTARDLVRTAELEKKSAELEKRASDVKAKGVRAVAIIEEAVARKGRAQDQLDDQPAPPPAPAEKK
jgi:hypothetical protein